MNKQELIEQIKGLKNLFGNKVEYIEIDTAIKLASELDEPQKPAVPQFVADWIEKAGKELSLRDLMSNSYISFEVNGWLGELDEDGGFKNQETFARAVLDGYEVEEEKRYTVKLKAVLGQYLGRYYLNNEKLTPQFIRTQFTGRDELPTFTRKELEEAGWGWVFDCEGIEVKEVE